MERIKVYLDNVFSSYPQNEETAKMKTNMYEIMLEKYRYLLVIGKNEDEAMGILTNEFGDIKIIEKYMKEDMKKKQKMDNTEMLSLVETEACIAKRKKGGVWVASGIVMIVFGYILTNIFDMTNCFQTGVSKEVWLLSIITIGILVVLVGGIQVHSSKNMVKWKAVVEQKEQVQGEYTHFKKKYYRNYVLSIVLFAISPLFLVVIQNNDLSSAVFLFVIAIALFIFISTGNENSAYKEILNLKQAD